MPRPDSDDFISKLSRSRWSRDRAPEISVRQDAEPPPRPRLPSLPRLKRTGGPRPTGWHVALVSAGVLAALAYHLLVLASLGEILAPFNGTLARAVEAWGWQSRLMAGLGLLLRLWALRTASRDPIAAVWIAAMAWGLDLIGWVTVGLKVPHDLDGAHALIFMLKAEGWLLLGLFGLIAPRGARKLGETDAHYNR